MIREEIERVHKEPIITNAAFDQSNKILDLPDYSRQVIKINT